MKTKLLEFKWTISRAQESDGYNICSLWADGQKVASCNGGGYDMKGTAFGEFIRLAYKDRLLKLKKEFTGLSFHNPNFDADKAVIGVDCIDRTLGGAQKGMTVKEAEDAGISAGLERHQAFYNSSSLVPTEKHNEPLIDGGYGFSSVETICEAIGLKL